MRSLLEEECAFTCPSTVVRKDFVLSFKTPGNRCFLYKFTLISKPSSKLAVYSPTSLTGFLSSVFHWFDGHLFLILSCILLMRHEHTLSFLSMSKPTSLLATNKKFLSFAQSINIISVDQKLNVPIRLKSLEVFVDIPDSIFLQLIGKQCQ